MMGATITPMLVELLELLEPEEMGVADEVADAVAIMLGSFVVVVVAVVVVVLLLLVVVPITSGVVAEVVVTLVVVVVEAILETVIINNTYDSTSYVSFIYSSQFMYIYLKLYLQ